MAKILGLDLGIASIGWTLIDDIDKKIIDLGVRLFPGAEHPKTKESLALPRRVARSTRRRLKRKSRRLSNLRESWIKHGVITAEQIHSCFQSFDTNFNPWKIRSEGLDRLLTSTEWFVCNFHICKHRGYRSNGALSNNEQEKWHKILAHIPKESHPSFNLASEKKEGEAGTISTCISENLRLMEEKGYRTVGEMIYKDLKFADRKRNSLGNYSHTLLRADLGMEIIALFEAQKKMGNIYTSESLLAGTLEILSRQKPFASGDQIKKMIGKCTFFPDKKRAARASYSAEKFVALSKINNLRVKIGSVEHNLLPEQMRLLFEKAHEYKQIKYIELRKILGYTEGEDTAIRFNLCRYSKEKKISEAEKEIFIELKNFHLINAVLKDLYTAQELILEQEQNYLLDTLATSLTWFKTREEVKKDLTQMNVPCDVIERVLGLESFDKTINLSLKAVRILNPILESGVRYDEAVLQAGLILKGESKEIDQTRALKHNPEDFDDITNPVVRRSLAQTRKLVRAVIQKHGNLAKIHIELARELSKSKEDRNKLKKIQEENKTKKNNALNKVKESFPEVFKNTEPKSLDILKFRLYNEQQGKCLYSLKAIDLDRLMEPGYVEIDHILPYSRTCDDSLSNKALVLTQENQQKGNKTPREYLFKNEEQWEELCAQWKNLLGSYRMKYEKLTRTDLSRRLEDEFITRNLNDTRYLARFAKNYFHEKLGIPVDTINGQMTAFLRARWGLEKIRSSDSFHHALDASVVAFATVSMVQAVAKYHKKNELKYQKEAIRPYTNGEVVDLETGEILPDRFPLPYENYRDDIHSKSKRIFPSVMPNRKHSGPIHDDTIRSIKHLDKGVSYVKKSLESFKLKDIEHYKEWDINIYNVVAERLNSFGDDPKKAFKEPLYKKLKDGSNGPQIKKLLKEETQKTGVYINHGIADKGSQIRVDVFKSVKGYYFVPLYTSDIVADVIPNKAIVQGKKNDDWLEMDDKFDFQFSLYQGDSIEIHLKEEVIEGFYWGIDAATGNLTLKNLSMSDIRKGCLRATLIKKFEVDLLGSKFPIVKGQLRIPLRKGQTIPKYHEHGLAYTASSKPGNLKT